MKKQIISLLSAGILLCGLSVSALAAENADFAGAAETEEAAAFAADDEVSANYPVVSDFENTATGIRVYWKAYSGAARYGLFYLGADGWHGIATTTSLNMEYENLKNGTAYTFTVRALNSSGDFISDYNRDGWSHTFMAPPVISELYSTDSGVSVSWNALKGEKKYRVYRMDDSHGWARIGDTAETTFIDKTAASGTRYSYTVRAITADGSRETTYFNPGKSIYYVAAPRVTEIVNRDGITAVSGTMSRPPIPSAVLTTTEISSAPTTPQAGRIPTLRRLLSQALRAQRTALRSSGTSSRALSATEFTAGTALTAGRV